jgi:hypothetical protein
MSWGLEDKRVLTQDDQATIFAKVLRGSWGDATYLLPELVAGAGPMHPLLTWWAVLYSLSMLARYSPDRWIDSIATDSSPYAVAIEQVLDRAIQVCPELIVSSIRQISGA